MGQFNFNKEYLYRAPALYTIEMQGHYEIYEKKRKQKIPYRKRSGYE